MRNRNKNFDMDKDFEDFLDRLFDTPPHDDIRNKRKAFHITIVENDSGRVIADTDTNCICGAFDEDNGTRQVGLSKCNIVELIATCAAAKESVNKMTDDNPIAQLLLKTGD